MLPNENIRKYAKNQKNTKNVAEKVHRKLAETQISYFTSRIQSCRKNLTCV